MDVLTPSRIQRALQNDLGGQLIDHLFLVSLFHFYFLAEEILHDAGGKPLVEKTDLRLGPEQTGIFQHLLREQAGTFGGGSLAAVHIIRQADDKAPGLPFQRQFGKGLHIGADLVARQGEEGGGDFMRRIADGDANRRAADIKAQQALPFFQAFKKVRPGMNGHANKGIGFRFQGTVGLQFSIKLLLLKLLCLHPKPYTLNPMTVDTATVKRIANLARLRLSDADAEAVTPEFNHILQWIGQLQEVNTDNVPPLTSVVETRLPMREDKVSDGGYPADVLANAPKEAAGFFVVPKVVE
jgi:aspartyl-tRNA(Asn)/glutamyl-tRNA(Gln) amidotransferase subunit C